MPPVPMPPAAPMDVPRAAERLRGMLGRLLSRLPGALAVRLSGEPPVVVDGCTLDPHVQLVRAAARRAGMPGLCEPTVEAGRRRYAREALAARPAPLAVGRVADLQVDGADGPLRARWYVPAGGSDRLLVYFHGGGFVVGDLDTHDEPCRWLCREARTQVLSVAYRLAPEHPFPAAVEDAVAAVGWALANATGLGADPARVAVGGDSAGGNLATVATRLLAGAGARLAGQLLIYPAVDTRAKRPSHALFGDGGFFLTTRDRGAFSRHYLRGTTVSLDDPRLAPLRAPSLAGMPPALVVTAGFDILRDDGEAYAKALRRAGTRAETLRFPSLVHGFLHMTHVSPGAARALRAVAAAWRALLAS
jgi:acetyl esterase